MLEEDDAVVLHDLAQPRPEHGLEIPQHAVAAQHHGHLAVERSEHTGELHRDVAAAHDRHPLRSIGKLEEPV